MKEIINELVQKVGLSTEDATKSAETMIGFVKGKLPPFLSDKLEDLLQGKFDLSSLMSGMGGNAAGGGATGESPLDKLTSMFGKK